MGKAQAVTWRPPGCPGSSWTIDTAQSGGNQNHRFGLMIERFGELGGRMTFINFSDLHVFEALLAKGPNGFDDLHQVFPGWGRHVEAGFFS